MLRADLIEKLSLVAPALSDNNLVPVLSHFWFTGHNTLMAYNDQIAISVRLDCDFSGAVPKTLTSLLNASRAKEVEFVASKEALEVKAASSKFKLPYLSAKAFDIFKMPDPSDGALPVDIKEFIEAIDSCMKSLKEDTSMPDSLGITLVYNNKGIDLYATNDATISHARIKTKADLKKGFRVVISGNFCRQMLSLAKLSGDKHLEVHDDFSLFVCGDNLLFGRLVDVARPLDFDSVIQQSFPKEAAADLVTIPSKLELILDRAVIITESKQERPKTDIVIKDGRASFFSKSENGEVRDSMQVEPNHPEVEVSIDPRLFRAGYGAYDKMLLTEQCLIMSKGSSLYLVSAAR